MLGEKRQAIHLVGEQDLGLLRLVEWQPALVVLLGLPFEAVVPAGEDDVRRRLRHPSEPEHVGQVCAAPARRADRFLDPGLADDGRLDQRPAVSGALHRRRHLDCRQVAQIVERERQRRRDEPPDLESVRRLVDERDVVVDQEVVEPRRRDRVTERLERQRVVSCREPQLVEADPGLAGRHALSLVQVTEVEHDRLQVGHVEHRVAATDPTPTGLRTGRAAERFVRLPVVGRVVDDHVSDAELLDVLERPREASRVDGRLEPEVGVVGGRERRVVGVDRDQRNDRAERFLAVDERVQPDAVDDRRLVVEAGGSPVVARAAEDDVGALRHRVLEMAVHLLGGRLVVHRADERVLVERVAEPPALGLLDHCIEELVVHGSVDEDALRRATDLACAEEAAEDGALRRPPEIGVLTDDDGTVARCLDQAALEPGGADDLRRRPVRADESDAVDVRARHEPLTDLSSAVDDVDDAVGQPRVGHDLHEIRHRHGRPLGRLHDDRVARRDAWRDQLHGDQRGEVPRRDACVDAVWLAEREDALVDVL